MRARSFALLPILAACAPVQPAPPPLAGTCNDAPLAAFVGRTADEATKQEMLRASGARVLRWVGPDMAVTMDYSPDRLTVSYDHAMKIISASCG